MESKETIQANNKRIAKNSIMLYARMFLTLGIKLYTSRVVLNALGVEDFGIYNAVAGVITLFTFINSSMINATQRFLTFELGKNNQKQLSDVFCTSINIHAIISLIIVLLGETIGIYILNYKMEIPDYRIFAANTIYQFTIISAIIGIMSVPYNALIIAHEKMGVFAYITILEVIIQLIIAIIIGRYNSGDRLVLYGLLITISSIIIRLIYGKYSSKHFKESHYRFFINWPIFKQMASFAGWTVIGTFCYMGYTQGINILLNMFFGPIINAANGIALQVQASALGFSSNIQKAINPQITKSYASNNNSYMMKLVYASTKFSFFLLWLLVLPLIFDANILLHLWLGNVPDYTREFLILTLFNSIICCGANPIITAIQATGNIRKYQIIEGAILISIIPITYVFFFNGASPLIAFFVPMTIHTIAQATRCFLLRQQINYSITDYFKSNIIPMLLQIVLSLGFSYFLIGLIELKGIVHLVLVVIITVIINIILAFFILMNKSERTIIKQYRKKGMDKTKTFISKNVLKKIKGGGGISIIIPLYNKEKSIRETILSVLTQTYKDFELIIIDDGSTDNSYNIVKSIADPRIKYFYQENHGVSSARNHGVRVSKYNWILFLDADDILYKDCLSLLLEPTLQNRLIDICCGRYHKLKNDTTIINSNYNYEGFIKNNYKWLFQNRFGLRTGCCIIRKDILQKYPFDESLSRFEDMKCILEWLKENHIYRINAPVMAYRNDFSLLSKLNNDSARDFTFHLNFQNKTFWEKCILGKILYLGWIGYKDKHQELKNRYGIMLIYIIIAKIGIQINKIRI